MSFKKLLILGASILFLGNAFAQKTLSGTVTDYDTKEAVSFANVWIKNSNSGCLTQLDGTFSIKVPKSSDTVLISAIGYQEYQILYSNIKPNMEIILTPAAIMLEEAVIRPGKNPAIAIVKSAIHNRRENKPDQIENIDFIEYNKLNLSFSGLNNSFRDNNFIKKHPEILVKLNDYDTTWSIPLYFSERLSYEKRVAGSFPETEEIIQNQYGSSFINSDITTKYINSLNDDMTFYGNIRFLSKDFISPISPQALIYYKYYIKDSIVDNGNVYYRINFRPRNKQDLAFYGYMIIEKETGVLTETHARLQQSANLNYVKDIQINEKLQKHYSGKWFYQQQKLQIEFTPQLSQDTTNNALNTPMQAIKTTSYIIDTAQVKKYLGNRKAPEKYTLINKEVIVDTSILAEYRPDTLSTLDIITKDAIEVSNEIPAIKTTNQLLDMFLYGYLPLGYVELGPYLYFVQHNEIEGYRINLSGRTSAKFSKNMLIGGYLGYGLDDKEFKYGAKYSIKLPTKKLHVIHALYEQNIYRIGDYKQNLNYVRENVLVQSDDNVLSALTSKAPNKAVYFVKKAQVAYEYQAHPNLIIKPELEYSLHYDSPFYHFDTVTTLKNFSVKEANVDFRISFKEEVSINHFKKMYIDSRYPIFHINLAQGQYNIRSETAAYTKLRFVAKQDILLGVGRLKYVIESGTSLGKVPYPLLEYHRGNETGSSGEYYFNMMKYLEFASDRFVNIYTEYGMNGFVFHKIPLLKKLNLRELITYKACWGSLNYNHESVLDMPTNTIAPTKPYMELGLGVTNFFKLIRVEYIWRLNYLEQAQGSTSGLFFRFQFEF